MLLARGLAIQCLAVSAALAGTAAALASPYGITPIGVLSGYASSRLAAVTPDGSLVVGWSGDGNPESGMPGDPGRAIAWTPSQGMVNLGALPGGAKSLATAVSDNGSVIVGWGESSDRERAFRWTSATGMQDLGKLTANGWSSFAYDISGDGELVIGEASETQLWAIKWTAAAGMQPLQPSGSYSSATAISRSGRVVIGSYRPTGSSATDSAAKWTADEGFSLLGLLPGAEGGWATANGLNTDGSIIVGSNSLNPGWKAVVWRNSLSPQELPLPAGTTMAWPNATSDNGALIVGAGVIPFIGSRAAVWRNMNQAQWLDEYLSDLGVDLNGWSRLATVSDVTPDGQTIVGNGVYNGVYQGFVATVPEPSTCAMALAGIACGGYLVRWRRKRA